MTKKGTVSKLLKAGLWLMVEHLSPVESKSTALTSLILLLSVGLVEDTQL
jgi:hypothetical protein